MAVRWTTIPYFTVRHYCLHVNKSEVSWDFYRGKSLLESGKRPEIYYVYNPMCYMY